MWPSARLPVSHAPYPKRPCREAKSQKGKGVWCPLAPSQFLALMGLRQNASPARANPRRDERPLEVHNSESKPCIQHMIRTNACLGGERSSAAEQAPACGLRILLIFCPTAHRSESDSSRETHAVGPISQMTRSFPYKESHTKVQKIRGVWCKAGVCRTKHGAWLCP